METYSMLYLIASFFPPSKPSEQEIEDKKVTTEIHGLLGIHVNAICEEWTQLFSNPHAKLDALDSRDWTPLMWAARGGKIDLMRVLITAKANMEKQSVRGMSALMIATSFGKAEAVQVLINAQADINAKNTMGVTSLMLATAFGQITVMQRLIAAGADLNAKNKTGMTALMFAAALGRTAELQILISAGVALEEKDMDGLTALNYAVRSSRKEIMKELIDEYINPAPHSLPPPTNIQNRLAMELLVIAGADIKACDHKGRSVLAYAAAIPQADMPHFNVQEMLQYIGSFQWRLERIKCNDPIDARLKCPISHKIMNDPITLSNGITYDRTALEKYFAKKGSPEQLQCRITRLEINKNELTNTTSVECKKSLEHFVAMKEAEARREKRDFNLEETACAVTSPMCDRFLLDNSQRVNNYQVGPPQSMQRMSF